MTTTSELRQKVLSLYRTTLRLSRTWVATDPLETQKERAYIVQEARTLFRRNKHVNAVSCVLLFWAVIYCLRRLMRGLFPKVHPAAFSAKAAEGGLR